MKLLITFLILFLSNTLFCQNLESIGHYLFSYTVQERIKNNVKAELIMSESLCKAAKIQADLILKTGVPTHEHTSPSLRSVRDRVSQFGFKSSPYEIITCFTYQNVADSLVARRAVNNFMNSKGHKYTLLTDDIFDDGHKVSYGHCVLYDYQRKWIIVVEVFVLCIWEEDLLIK